MYSCRRTDPPRGASSADSAASRGFDMCRVGGFSRPTVAGLARMPGRKVMKDRRKRKRKMKGNFMVRVFSRMPSN